MKLFASLLLAAALAAPVFSAHADAPKAAAKADPAKGDAAKITIKNGIPVRIRMLLISTLGIWIISSTLILSDRSF